MTGHWPPSSGQADQYLWEAKGDGPADIARLEEVLSPLRYQPRPLAPSKKPAGTGMPWRWRWLRAAAMLAVAMAGIATVALFSTALEDAGSPGTQQNAASRHGGWNITAIAGRPRVGQRAVSGRTVLVEGQWLETDEHATAEVQVADIGEIEVAPRSRMRLIAANDKAQRMELQRGSIRAFISAPPRLFMVDMPNATAIDLGCAYTLDVDDHGAGVLKVTLGWVSLERNGREVVVPRNAQCRARPGAGPGTPIFHDAPALLREAVDDLDFGAGGAHALDVALNLARDRDSLTLWHLMIRENDGDNRRRLLERLVRVEPLPEGITLSQVLDGDAAAIARWRSEFAWSPPH
jgi:hypothetical protein